MKDETPRYVRRLNAALALRDVPDYPAALAQVEEALQEAPDEANVFLVRGLVYKDLGNRQEAVENFRRALGLDPDWEPLRETLASLLFEQRRYNDVIRLVQGPIESGRAGSELWYLYSAAALSKLWGEASQDVETAFAAILAKAEAAGRDKSELQLRLARLYQALAEYYLGTDFPEPALTATDTGLALFPRYTHLLRLRVKALLAMNRYEEALQLIMPMQQDGTVDLHWDEYVARLGTGDTTKASSIAARYEQDDFWELGPIVYRLREQGLFEAASAAANHFIQHEAAFGEDFLPFLMIAAEAGSGAASRAENTLRYVMDRVASRKAAQPQDARIAHPWLDEAATGLVEWYEDTLELELHILLQATLAYILLWKGEYTDAVAEYSAILAERPRLERYVIDEFIPVVACYKDELVRLQPPQWPEQWLPELIQLNLATAYCMTGETGKALAMTEASTAPPDNRDAYLAYTILGCVQLAAGNKEAARDAWEKVYPEKDRGLLGEWLADLDTQSA